MAIIKVQSIPQREVPPEETLALFCHYFPQYTFATARKMPLKRIRQMLNVVQKERARFLLALIEVVKAPHTKDQGKSLKESLNDIIDS